MIFSKCTMVRPLHLILNHSMKVIKEVGQLIDCMNNIFLKLNQMCKRLCTIEKHLQIAKVTSKQKLAPKSTLNTEPDVSKPTLSTQLDGPKSLLSKQLNGPKSLLNTQLDGSKSLLNTQLDGPK